MAYRQPSTTAVLCGVTAASEFHVLNGTTVEFAFPCVYAIPYEGEVACGMPTPDPEIVEIHLTEEGYAAPVIAFDGDLPDGLVGTAWIDEVDDHIIRFVLTANCADAISENLSCMMSCLLTRETESHGPRTDAAFRGRVVVVAAPLPNPGL